MTKKLNGWCTCGRVPSQCTCEKDELNLKSKKADMEKIRVSNSKLIDRAVSDFFEKGYCWIYSGRTSIKIHHQFLLDIFINRMESEHIGQGYVYKYGKFDGIWCFKVEKHDL